MLASRSASKVAIRPEYLSFLTLLAVWKLVFDLQFSERD
jgi:hypothetical protein